jgi:tetratricopeptide (TPR) repeat protein
MRYNLPRFLLVNLGLYILINHTFSQENSNLKELFLEAESYFLYEEYLDAIPIYTKLKEQSPDNYNLDYKIGRCYLSIPFERSKAIVYLERAAKNILPDYKKDNLKETKAPPDALFYLGDAYRINNLLDKAIDTYKKFKKLASETIYDFKLVDHQITCCERAKELMKRKVDVTFTNLGELINTRFADTNPVVSEDETMLVYASMLPFYQALFYSKKVDGKWTAPINMIPELGVDGDCFPTSLSPDGNELYLYRSNEFQGDLYVTNFNDGKWSKIRKLNDNINTKYWESHACISHDGKTLYFTSNRKGGNGGLDIYKSERTSDDNWGPAQNLGAVINSSYNEETPFIVNNDKRLYFSSFGHDNMGGYDIFYSDLNSDGTWTQPVNVGFPINSTDDDIFFNPLRNGTVAYMARFDTKGLGREDIFRLQISMEDNVPVLPVNQKIHVSQNLINHRPIDFSSAKSEKTEKSVSKENPVIQPEKEPSDTNQLVSAENIKNVKDTLKLKQTGYHKTGSLTSGRILLYGGLIIVLLISIFIFLKRRKKSSDNESK